MMIALRQADDGGAALLPARFIASALRHDLAAVEAELSGLAAIGLAEADTGGPETVWTIATVDPRVGAHRGRPA